MRPEVVELGPTKEDSRETFTAMDRRSFFRSMVGGVAAAAAVRTWPFRVFSFPADIAVPKLILNPGDVVQFAGCFKVNPQTGKELSILQTFVITEPVFSGRQSSKSLPLFPAILTGGPYKNCATLEGFIPDLEHMHSVYGINPVILRHDEFASMYPDAATRPTT